MSTKPSGMTRTASAAAVSGIELLHLFGLNGMAVAQPVMDRLRRNCAYLTLEGFGTPSVLISLLIILTLLPAIMCGLILACQFCGAKSTQRLHRMFVLSFFLLMISMAGCTIYQQLSLARYGVPDALLIPAAALASIPLIKSYHQRKHLHQILSWCVLSVLVIPMFFFSSATVRETLFPPTASPPAVTPATHPVPIVMIVFDGLPMASLCNAEHTIDEALFPGFHRLSSLSTWYRNASTVHYRTDRAVPAMLTSRYPEGLLFPVEADHPQNLFRFLHDTEQYDMAVFEPLTRLCPREMTYSYLHPQRSPGEEVQEILRTLSLVYFRTALPETLCPETTIIPKKWFGFASVDPLTRDQTQGQIAWP
ncbi:MAG: hypothetical protein KDA85_21370, partial [Planctomycetaceae bacterium]|nr:hypothetical protein [Planctomycetaceae bacterium]